ncbi:MAG: hypothetical protein ACFFEK_00130 [Candidatus Thorarchaeota archaeon]
MDYRYPEDREYPRRGRYGDTTQRCAWCGNPTNYGDRICVGGLFRRNYCSFTCRAAGDYYCFIAIGIIYPLFLVYSIWVFQAFPGTQIFENLSFMLITFGALPTICLWSCVFCGRSERRRA